MQTLNYRIGLVLLAVAGTLFFFQNYQTPLLRLGDDETDTLTMNDRSLDLLERKCGSCHGHPSAGRGGVSAIGDIKALIKTGLIVPGFPEKSRLFSRVTHSAPMTQEEVQLLRDWVTGL